MLDIFNSLLDLVAPPPDSVQIIRKYTPHDMVRYFSPERIGDSFTLAHFHSPVIHAAIVANKFHDYPKSATLLASLLEHWLQTLPSKKTYVAPIPLGQQRARERGYNQVERIISAVSVANATPLSLLKRTRETAPQTSLTREARFNNVAGAFLCAAKLPIDCERLIIVDDVLTTGATLRAASAATTPHLPPHCELLTVAIAH